jgi:DNA repair exonuclease SbcCD ATPase subunit
MRKTSYSCDLCGRELSKEQVDKAEQTFTKRIQTHWGLSTQIQIIAKIKPDQNEIDSCWDCLLKTLRTL